MCTSVLEVKNLVKKFHNNKTKLTAVDHVSFSIAKGEIFGLLGESGSGKTTIAQLVSGFQKPTSGRITVNGRMQMVFQNPIESLQPRMKVIDALSEGMRYHSKASKDEIRSRALEVLKLVGLDETYAGRYPGELSGGQCQRAAIGRAIMLPPDLLICDEVTSALDVSVQAQIVSLLKELQQSLGMSILFITHDIALAGVFCNKIAVMQKGTIVEAGTSKEITLTPTHPYTKQLVESVLNI